MSRRKPAAAPAPPPGTFAAPQAETDAVLTAAKNTALRLSSLRAWLEAHPATPVPFELAAHLVTVLGESAELAAAVGRFRSRMEGLPHG